MSRRTPGRRLLVLAAFALLWLSLVPSSVLGESGKSANAKQCQKGGWTTVVRADGTTFVDRAACLAYAARGGTFHQKATISFSRLVYKPIVIDRPGQFWFAYVAGTGFTPSAPITFSITFGISDPSNGDFLNPHVSADETGAFDSFDVYLATDAVGFIQLSCSSQTVTVTATDGTHLSAYTADIPACPTT